MAVIRHMEAIAVIQVILITVATGTLMALTVTMATPLMQLEHTDMVAIMRITQIYTDTSRLI